MQDVSVEVRKPFLTTRVAHYESLSHYQSIADKIGHAVLKRRERSPATITILTLSHDSWKIPFFALSCLTRFAILAKRLLKYYRIS